MPAEIVAVPAPERLPVIFTVLPESVRLSVLPDAVEELPRDTVLAESLIATLLAEAEVIVVAVVLTVPAVPTSPAEVPNIERVLVAFRFVEPVEEI